MSEETIDKKTTRVYTCNICGEKLPDDVNKMLEHSEKHKEKSDDK